MTCPKASQNIQQAMETQTLLDDTDDFTTVTNHHNRKERKNHDKIKRDKQPKQPQNTQSNKHDSSAKDKNENQPSVETEKLEKKVFVEAPLPKINPWQTNKNAAQFLLGQEKKEPLPPPLPPQQHSAGTLPSLFFFICKRRNMHFLLFFRSTPAVGGSRDERSEEIQRKGECYAIRAGKSTHGSDWFFVINNLFDYF